MTVDTTETTWTSATSASGTAASLAHPVELAANPGGVGDMLLIILAYGNSTGADPSLTANPSTFADLGDLYDGAGVWGSDTGSRGIKVWWKVSDGTETDGSGASAVSVGITNGGTGTDRIQRAVMARFGMVNATGWATPVARFDGDSSSGTAYNIVAATDPGGVAGDMLVGAGAIAPSTVNHTGSNASVFTWTGATATSASGNTGTATGGNKVRLNVYTMPAAGPSSAAPSMNLTLGSAGAGVGVLVRLRTTGEPPSAFVGSPQDALPWASVTLDGTESTGSITSYTWTQTAGTTVTLGGSGAVRTFTAPASVAGETLTFQLEVDDGSATDTDTVDVTVREANTLGTQGGSYTPFRMQGE